MPEVRGRCKMYFNMYFNIAATKDCQEITISSHVISSQLASQLQVYFSYSHWGIGCAISFKSLYGWNHCSFITSSWIKKKKQLLITFNSRLHIGTSKRLGHQCGYIYL